MKNLVLREYGSWSVFIVSFLTGVFVRDSGGFYSNTLPLFVGVALLINSKLHVTHWLRQGQKKALAVFVVHIIAGIFLLFASLGNDMLRLLSFSIIPILYLILFYKLGEHHILAELTGFATLTLSVLVSNLAVTGEIDHRLYILTFTYFASGVFKVRVQLRKTLKERIIMVLYVLSMLLLYPLLGIPVIPLLPLLENIIHSITLYRVKLRLTGWIEVAKSIVFLLLTIGYY